MTVFRYLILLCLSLAGWALPGWRFTTTHLGDIVLPADQRQHPLVSPGGRHVVQVRQFERNGAQVSTVVIDGQVGKTYPGSIAFPRRPFSPDGARLAYLVQDDAGLTHVVADGVEETGYLSVIPQSVIFSPDGRRLAYIAETPDGWHVVVDGKPGAAYPWLQGFQRRWGYWDRAYQLEGGDRNSFWTLNSGLDLMSDTLECLLFSPDGSRLAYAAYLAEDDCRLIADGQEGKGYRDIALLRFTPDSRHLLAWARDDSGWVMLRNGEEWARYDTLSAPTLSPDGRRFACVAGAGNTQRVLLDNTMWYSHPARAKTRADDPSPTFVFSADSRRLAYMAPVGDGWRVVVDGKEGMEYASVWGATFSADGRRFAYAVIRDGRRRMVIDEQEGPAFDKISGAVFSPDAHAVAYAGKRGDRWRIVRDGTEGLIFARVQAESGDPTLARLVFSPDSHRLAYIAQRDEQWHVVLDGVTGAPYHEIDGASFTFSPDSRHAAYIATTAAGKVLVVDGKAGKPYYDIAQPVFSADSRHLAYLVRTDQWSWRAVIDGQESDPVTAILGWNDDGIPPAAPHPAPRHWLVFDTPTRLHYFARTADAVVRVEGAWEE